MDNNTAHLEAAELAAEDLIASLDALAMAGIGPAAALVAQLKALLGHRVDKSPIMAIGGTDVSAVGVYTNHVTLSAFNDIGNAVDALEEVEDEQGGIFGSVA